MQKAADEGQAVSTTSAVLSIIVPAHECAEDLKACLLALESSTLSRRSWELIVIVDGSSDETSVVAAQHANLVIRLPGDPLGPDYARNRGVEVSRGDVLVFVSADVCVRPDALELFAEALTDDGVGAVSGMYEYEPRGHPLTDFQALYNQFIRDRAAGEVDAFFPGFGATRRSVFLSAGGFDEWRARQPRVAGRELAERIRSLGARVLLAPNIRARHLKRHTLSRMLQQTVRDHGIPYEQAAVARAEAVNSGLRSVRRQERLSPLLSWFTVDTAMVTALGIIDRRVAWLAAAAALAFVILNAPFYVFAVRQHGVTLLTALVPIHFVGSMLVGTARLTDRILRWVVGEPRPNPTIEAYVEVGVQAWPPVPIRRTPAPSGSSGD